MTEPRSNSRRFVNAAWSLLTFQLIASVGAVGVTGVAAFHVANLVNGAQQAGAPVEAAVETATAATEEAAPAATEPAPAAATADASEAAPATAPAAPVNLGPGSVTLASSVEVGIVATISDPDGIRGVRRVQWSRNGQPVPGVTGTTYPVYYVDNQAMIVARVDYVDGHGFDEVAVSAPLQATYYVQ